jgi:tRNA (guanine-N7-)-methyltransferase
MNPITDEVVSTIPSTWIEVGAPPLEIDFGCHRGAFFIGMAGMNEGTNFLGLEKQADRVNKCLRKIGRLGLSNAFAVQGLGSEPLQKLLPTASVTTFHLYFPDPWPKRRHAGRRVFQASFLEEIRRVLRPSGTLRLMTDCESYFLEMRDLTRVGWREMPWDDGRETVETAFEKTFRAMGMRPHQICLQPFAMDVVAATSVLRDEFGTY